MDLGLTGKNVFISGGSRGIGRAAALAFAEEGARVAISFSSDPAKGEATRNEISSLGVDAIAVYLDLGNLESISSAVKAIGERWGGIDVFVANAVRWPRAIPRPDSRFEELVLDEWQDLMRSNVEGTFACVQAVLPAMRGRPDGRIVLISSDVARRGAPGLQHYGTAKAAVDGLTRGLVAELRGDILVNIVTPGLTVTENNLALMPQSVRDNEISHAPTRRLSTPEDVARAIVFLGSPLNRNITGETVNVTGGS
jgi:NAD(P)-dependent dehydrogenase (short-subunit alcohol dehydrogenase family)